jgi:hypothetical protein
VLVSAIQTLSRTGILSYLWRLPDRRAARRVVAATDPVVATPAAADHRRHAPVRAARAGTSDVGSDAGAVPFARPGHLFPHQHLCRSYILVETIHMNVDIETLVRYPMESDDWIRTVGIGGLALIFSFLLVPIFLVSGYLVRAIRAGMEGTDEPPVFDEWESLLKEGVLAAVIAFVYQLIPLIVFGIAVGGSIVAFATGSRTGAGAGLLGLFGGMFVSWLLSLVFGFIGFAGVANYAREGSFSAGFDFDVITDVVTSRPYLMAWLYVIVLNIVVAVVVGVLNVVPFLGAIVGAFVSFYALVIAGWLWGDGFAEATGARTESEAGPGAAVA